jgi:hypothetical protein
MNASRNYTTKQFVKDNDPEIELLLKQHPLWRRATAKQLLARRRFAEAIRKAADV